MVRVAFVNLRRFPSLSRQYCGRMNYTRPSILKCVYPLYGSLYNNSTDFSLRVGMKMEFNLSFAMYGTPNHKVVKRE